MKNALLIAVLALSFNAFAQNVKQISNEHYATSHPPKTVLAITEDSGISISEINYDKNFEVLCNHHTPMLFSPIQLLDSSYIWLWDTLIADWKAYYKTIDMVYDENNNLTSYIGQQWNGSEWVNTYKITYTYDGNNNVTSEFAQQWIGSAWINFFSSIYSYDVNNNQIRFTHQLWFGSWVNDDQRIYTYDANNNQISYTHQDWNGSEWVNTYQRIYTYDANNNQTRVIYQSWIGSIWENIYQSISTYATNNNLIIELSQSWNGSEWVNEDQYTYAYDANNNPTIELVQSWNGSEWVNWNQNTAAYDINNNRISVLVQGWNGNEWVNWNQFAYTYDANNNLTSGLIQSWNGIAWVNASQSFKTYIDNFLESQSHKYFNETGSITFGDSMHYYFHSVTTTNDVTADVDSITVFPNPCSGMFTIKSNNTITNIEVYNLSGQQIYCKNYNKEQASTEIDLSGQGQGVYIINIYEGDKMYNRMIVVL